MDVLIQKFLCASLLTTPIILFLLLVMPRFCRRYSARLRCFVWMVLSVRLLIPVEFSSLFVLKDLPFTNLLDQIDKNAVITALMEARTVENNIGDTGYTIPSLIINWHSIGLIWLTVLLLFLCYNIIAYHITVKRLQKWSVPVTDPAFLEKFEEVKKQLSISRNIALYHTKVKTPPMILGFIKPRIYIPNKQICITGFQDIISHELWHYKRKDLWFKLVLLLTSVVHWFNPFVFLMLRQVELDIEIACDNDVLCGATPLTRKQYALTILSSFEEASSVSKPLTTTFYGGKNQMKSRFLDIINPNKKKSGVVFVSFIALLLVISCSLANNGVFASPVQESNTVNNANTADLSVNHSNGTMAWPVPGFYSISSEYGLRYDNEDFHLGIDISEKEINGASVIAAETGTVVSVATEYNPGKGYGKYILLKHDGNITTMYAHLDNILVKVGDSVEKGQVIGNVGATGFANEPHLHFEVREGAETANPVMYLMPVEKLIQP